MTWGQTLRLIFRLVFSCFALVFYLVSRCETLGHLPSLTEIIVASVVTAINITNFGKMN